MVIIVMGVSGSGKSLIGERLAQKLSLPFYDADDFHPPENVKKMAEGLPLDDQDRTPWLESLADHINLWNQQKGAVLACSALKEQYRRLLSDNYQADVQFAYLKGERELILSRMKERNHFFPPHLLDSQFADLEVPARAVLVDINQAPEAVVNQLASQLNLHL